MFELIDLKNFPTLLQTLEKRLPKSAMLYNVTVLLQKGLFPSIISTNIYSYQGKLEEAEAFQNLFIVAKQFRQINNDYAIILSSPDVLSPQMVEAFEMLIDWNHPNCFCGVDKLFSKVVTDICGKHKGLKAVDTTSFMTMPISETKQIEIRNPNPTIIQINELSPAHANLVSRRWKLAQRRTEILMSEYFKNIGSAGVFLNDDLVSWAVIFAIGSINSLYTEDDHRGKGYGKLTMQKIVKVAGDKGLVPNVNIMLDNIPSKCLMDSLGFVKSHEVEWIFYEKVESRMKF